MPKMVCIQQMLPHSFMVLTTNGEGFALRDFSSAGGAKAREIMRQRPPEFTTTRIRQLGSVLGNYFIEDVPEKPIDDYAYWHAVTVRLNKQYVTRDGGLWRKVLRKLADHVAYVVATVIAAVLTAGIVAWLKWK